MKDDRKKTSPKPSSPVCFIDSPELREEYRALPKPERNQPKQSKDKDKKGK
jgi:hypothetical protein